LKATIPRLLQLEVSVVAMEDECHMVAAMEGGDPMVVGSREYDVR